MNWKFWKKEKLVPVPKGPALACIHTGLCSKKACPLWVVYDKHENGKWLNQPEGKCALAWTPQLLIELRGALAKIVPPQGS